MQYEVVLLKSARKALDKIDIRYLPKIESGLLALCDDPYIGKRLYGKRSNEWSYRVSEYRILYEIRKQVLVVLIIDIGSRQGGI